MNKKYFIFGCLIIIGIGMAIHFYINRTVRYNSMLEAMNQKKDGNDIIHVAKLDPFTLYFYQEEDGLITFDYIFKDQLGFKTPTKDYSQIAYTEHQVIWHVQEKNGPHLVLISKCLVDKTPFTIHDSLNSNFQEITFQYNDIEYTYFVTLFETNPNNYKLFIDNEQIVEWEKY